MQCHSDSYFTPERVTYRAVTRYCQRILHVSLVDAVFDDPRTEAEAHCEACCTTLEAVRGLIWTPGVRAAVMMGLRTFWTREFGVQVNENFSVVTVVERPVRSGHRLRVMGKREADQKIRRIARREKQKSPKTLISGDTDV